MANSGNANACTGKRGLEDARKMAAMAAAVCPAEEDQVLVMSTGVIGERLPFERITAKLDELTADEKKTTDQTTDTSKVIMESPRSIPVVQDCDVCVLGGSCTGVFAAVRAAQEPIPEPRRASTTVAA